MKYLLTIPKNREALALLDFLLASNIIEMTVIEEDIPNKITELAIEEARQKKGKRFSNVDDLIKELNSE